MNKHTPEPWCVYNSESKIFDYQQKLIAFASSVPYRSHNAPANAARIVACVNALAGIEDPEAFVQQAKAAIAKDKFPFT